MISAKLRKCVFHHDDFVYLEMLKFFFFFFFFFAFSIDSRIPQNLNQLNISSANFYSEKDTMRILILHSKYTIPYNKK